MTLFLSGKRRSDGAIGKTQPYPWNRVGRQALDIRIPTSACNSLASSPTISTTAWLEEGQLLRDASRLAGIPGVMLHGQLDIGGPVDVPWLLAQAWPDVELHVIGEAGHQGNQRMKELILEAGERFADAP